MANLSTARDRFNAANSLLCLLQALEGKIATVELRNEIAVKGLVIQVDGFMNVVMKDVTVQGNDDQLYNFNKFFVRARNIRYVQIPDDINITKAIQDRILPRPRLQQSDLKNKKNLLARKRQRETLQLIAKQEQENKSGLSS